MLPPQSISRRALLRGGAASVAAVALAGCLPAESFGDMSALRSDPTLFVATTREAVDGAQKKPWYGQGRAQAMNVSRARLNPPGDRRFAASALRLSEWQITAIEPVTTGSVEPLLGYGPARPVLLYTHGFNTAFERAALDAAYLSDGIRYEGRTMVFSWPSRAGTLGLFDYGYDHESAMWSRDAMEDVLDQLAASPAVSRIDIVAHSMGTMLVMESLRQRVAAKGEGGGAKIGAIVFAAPDIDIDIFTSTADRIGPLARRITVVAATDDGALKVSRKLYGGVTRVGGVETAALQRIGIRVIDASGKNWGVIRHDTFLSNEQVRYTIRRAIASPEGLAI